MEEEWDFGFSSVNIEDIVVDSKAKKIYSMILPLLDNLAKDSDKSDYIKWPNRSEKIAEFKSKLEQILNS